MTKTFYNYGFKNEKLVVVKYFIEGRFSQIIGSQTNLEKVFFIAVY